MMMVMMTVMMMRLHRESPTHKNGPASISWMALLANFIILYAHLQS